MGGAMHKLKLSDFSFYRKELMGLSIIFIMLCHARIHHAIMPKFFLNFFVFFNIGVEIFLFVSGFGLYYSLKNIQNRIELLQWYKKRFNRIFIPYFFIEGPYWLIFCVIHSLGIGSFLYYFSFYSYFNEGVGAWFLVVLIPLYIISPLLYIFLNSKCSVYCLLISIMLVLGLSLIYRINDYNITHHFLYYFGLVVQRVPSFLLGMYLGRDIKNEKKISIRFIILFFIFFMLMKNTFFLSEIYRGWLITVPFCILLIVIFKLFDFLKLCYLNRFLSFLGERTLEIYLVYDVAVNSLKELVGMGNLLYWGSLVIGLIGGIIMHSIFNHLKKNDGIKIFR